MMKLFLASSRLGGLPAVTGRTGGVRVGFVGAAAAAEKQGSLYAEEDRRILRGFGFDLREVDILRPDPLLADVVADCDLLFVEGGNGFFLLDHVRSSGFDELIRRHVEQGKLYIGVSSGSMILGPDIGRTSLGDRAAAPGLRSTEGLGVIDIAILPHFGDPELTERHREILAAAVPYKILPLRDDQALVVGDAGSRVVHSP